MMDMQILLGVKEQVPCRILAVRVPDKIANERRRKMNETARDKGKTLSERVLKLAD
jgi:trans-aconitate methyltransferase